jgi:hypothetical protein
VEPTSTNQAQEAQSIIEYFKAPARLLSVAELREIKRRDYPPRGIYCWYLQGLPATVPTDHCTWVDGHVLSYIGIAPKREPKKPPTAPLFHRRLIRNHLGGYSSSSTFRRDLGIILMADLQLEPSLYKNNKPWFGPTEKRLTAWIEIHAKAAFVAHPAPWSVEVPVIGTLSPLLNIDHNADQPFRPRLGSLREELFRRAKSNVA